MTRHGNSHQDYYPSSDPVSPLGQKPSGDLPESGEESLFDVDEPPEQRPISLHRFIDLEDVRFPATEFCKHRPANVDRKQSLLTQALTSPDPRTDTQSDSYHGPGARSSTSTYSTASLASTVDLTSDGDNTSPARTSTPSPPLPSTTSTGLALLTPKGLDELEDANRSKINHHIPNQASSIKKPGIRVDDPAPRKRCITFACALPRRAAQAKPGIEPSNEVSDATGIDAPKRPCMLTFAYPVRTTQDAYIKLDKDQAPQQSNCCDVLLPRSRPTMRSTEGHGASALPPLGRSNMSSFDAHKSRVPRSYEFGEPQNLNDAWIHEKPRTGHKITITDTLRKENFIRRLGEEAEEEAIEEEKVENEMASEDDEEDQDKDSAEVCGELNSDEDVSDGGNETDDEDGFADSDDESESDLNYQFWSPCLPSSSTANDRAESIRSRPHRSVSCSSIESTIENGGCAIGIVRRGRKRSANRRSPKMRPGTPELPDSTDFVCGTLDEDRPLEAAYISCMQQRKIAKHGLIPQDVDPSFPTSDLENEDDDNHVTGGGSDEQIWVTGRPDDSDVGEAPYRRERGGRGAKSPSGTPPRRLRSPIPNQRLGGHRSPPPSAAAGKRALSGRSPPRQRNLFSQSPRRLRSPPPPHLRHLKSPPSSCRPSLSGSVKQDKQGINMPLLVPRPNLTHTKSLPRTPNPFWGDQRRRRLHALDRPCEIPSRVRLAPTAGEPHTRGPIDIVQGLETKRQRRKEKFWRQHCRQIGREKDRRCQPGKGAERMRELGLEMAGRCKVFGQRTQLVLSV